MSRVLGIDYGTKNVGVSISDEALHFAYPLIVLKNSPTLLDELARICKEKNIEKIILGESKNYQGEDNSIMVDARKFMEDIKNNTGIDVFLHPEFLTSVQVEKLQGKTAMTDASAAAIILQSYLDTENNK